MSVLFGCGSPNCTRAADNTPLFEDIPIGKYMKDRKGLQVRITQQIGPHLLVFRVDSVVAVAKLAKDWCGP